MNDDYRRGLEDGTRITRDDVICTMIGFQNDLHFRDCNPTYKAFQQVIEYMESTYGELMKPVKLL